MKCTLCNKEFPDNTSDAVLFMHFIKNHKKEIEDTTSNIKSELRNTKLK